MAASVTVRDGEGAEGPFRLEDLQTLALEIRVVAAPPGPMPLRIDVLTPANVVYAQLPVTLEPDLSGTAAVRQDLEVQGTPIEGLRMTGAWTFRLAPAGGTAPLATAEAQIAEAEIAE
ncbi:MAG TPA: hypothetical protein VEB43_19885 [Anaeromyxobacter sp.]|nr:hypothetical protein [Anaeromyxobacter sp.]